MLFPLHRPALWMHHFLLHSYETTVVEGSIVKPVETKMQFRTERQVPKLGVMLVGLGGNNGWCVTVVTSY